MTDSKSKPVVLSESANELKKNIGKAVIQINSDILTLIEVYKKGKLSGTVLLSDKDAAVEDRVKTTSARLEETIKTLQSQPDYVKSEGLDKLIKLMSTTTETAHTLFDANSGFEFVSKDKVIETQELAESAVSEMKQKDQMIANTFNDLSKTLSTISISPEKACTVESELRYLSSYKQERYRKLEKMLKKHMQDHTDKLEKAWKDEKENLDYTGLKEIRFEFDQADRQVRNSINEWERRKYSDVLADHLTDMHDQLFQVYYEKYTKMADIKRQEAAVYRKKERELQEYKNEKKRSIPSWSKNVDYSKYKPDLLSWDKEHHLTSASSKFGQFVEMLKKEDRLVTFEQVQTRLGKQRDEIDIIKKIVELLDAINEETCYNKLSKAWDGITNFKKDKSESLNDFFSRFETMQYSLNLADDSYVELGPKATSEDKELMFARKIELNDKLKAVILLKSLRVDDHHLRDILSKVNFNQEPAAVYESTKIAIRDICGSQTSVGSQDVFYTKPWSSQASRSRS